MKIKYWLLIFLFFIFLMPLFEQCFKFIPNTPLVGAYHLATDPTFSFADWWDGTYQENKSKYINDNIGFRPDLLRISNQIDYSFFTKLHFYGGSVGANNCLWDQGYINAYMGSDFIGKDSAMKILFKLKKVQDTMAAMGKTFVLIHAPCKGFYFSELLPAQFNAKNKGQTNLEIFNQIADSIGINQIDFNGWFLKLKGKSAEVIYSRKSIHWSIYGALLAFDSLEKYIQSKMGVEMPKITWNKSIHTTEARLTDDDLGQLLNLMMPVKDEVYVYPDFKFSGENSKQKQRAIYIGDSFLGQWYFLGLLPHINSKWQIWYYFSSLYDETFTWGNKYWPFNNENEWVYEINKSDYLVMLYTATNLPNLGNGFIEKAYNYYYPENLQ